MNTYGKVVVQFLVFLISVAVGIESPASRPGCLATAGLNSVKKGAVAFPCK